MFETVKEPVKMSTTDSYIKGTCAISKVGHGSSAWFLFSLLALAKARIPGTLDAGGHCVLEMPSGTGKTVSLLSLIVAYQQHNPEHRKLIYCSREYGPISSISLLTRSGTMSEIEKALAELRALMKYRTEQLGYEEDFRGLGLTSRKNLCLHPSVKREKSGAVVDARCRSLTAGFVKEKKERGEDVELCIYHDVRCYAVLLGEKLTFAELGSSGAAQPYTQWCMDLRRSSKIWRAA